MKKAVAVILFIFAAVIASAQVKVNYVPYNQSAKGHWSGQVVHGTAGEDLYFGRVVYLKSDGKWYKKSHSLSPNIGTSGIVVDPANYNRTVGVLLSGSVYKDSWSWTQGKQLYLSSTDGIMSHVPASTVEPLGVAIGTKQIFFNPSYSIADGTILDLSSGVLTVADSAIGFQQLSTAVNTALIDTLPVSQYPPDDATLEESGGFIREKDGGTTWDKLSAEAKDSTQQVFARHLQSDVVENYFVGLNAENKIYLKAHGFKKPDLVLLNHAGSNTFTFLENDPGAGDLTITWSGAIRVFCEGFGGKYNWLAGPVGQQITLNGSTQSLGYIDGAALAASSNNDTIRIQYDVFNAFDSTTISDIYKVVWKYGGGAQENAAGPLINLANSYLVRRAEEKLLSLDADSDNRVDSLETRVYTKEQITYTCRGLDIFYWDRYAREIGWSDTLYVKLNKHGTHFIKIIPDTMSLAGYPDSTMYSIVFKVTKAQLEGTYTGDDTVSAARFDAYDTDHAFVDLVTQTYSIKLFDVCGGQLGNRYVTIDSPFFTNAVNGQWLRYESRNWNSDSTVVDKSPEVATRYYDFEASVTTGLTLSNMSVRSEGVNSILYGYHAAATNYMYFKKNILLTVSNDELDKFYEFSFKVKVHKLGGIGYMYVIFDDDDPGTSGARLTVTETGATVHKLDANFKVNTTNIWAQNKILEPDTSIYRQMKFQVLNNRLLWWIDDQLIYDGIPGNELNGDQIRVIFSAATQSFIDNVSYRRLPASFISIKDRPVIASAPSGEISIYSTGGKNYFEKQVYTPSSMSAENVDVFFKLGTDSVPFKDWGGSLISGNFATEDNRVYRLPLEPILGDGRSGTIEFDMQPSFDFYADTDTVQIVRVSSNPLYGVAGFDARFNTFCTKVASKQIAWRGNIYHRWGTGVYTQKDSLGSSSNSSSTSMALCPAMIGQDAFSIKYVGTDDPAYIYIKNDSIRVYDAAGDEIYESLASADYNTIFEVVAAIDLLVDFEAYRIDAYHPSTRLQRITEPLQVDEYIQYIPLNAIGNTYHIKLSWDRALGLYNLYINGYGVHKASISMTTDDYQLAGNMYIGGDEDGNLPFSGVIKNLTISRRYKPEQLVPVMTLHYIYDSPSVISGISTGHLSRIVNYADSLGFKSVTFDQLIDWYNGKGVLPYNAYCIIVDDWPSRSAAWKDFKEYFDARDIYPTVAVMTNSMTTADWDTLRALQDHGWCVANHGDNHTDFDGYTEAQAKADLDSSKATFERNGFSPRGMVWPYNGADWQVMKLVKHYGGFSYCMGTNVSNPFFSKGCNTGYIGRYTPDDAQTGFGAGVTAWQFTIARLNEAYRKVTY